MVAVEVEQRMGWQVRVRMHLGYGEYYLEWLRKMKACGVWQRWMRRCDMDEDEEEESEGSQL